MPFHKGSIFRLGTLAAVASIAAGLVAILAGGRSVGASVSSASAGVETGVVDVSTTLTYEQETAAGTGIVLSSSGEVLTNNHVIRGETAMRVTDVVTGRSYGATVLGYDVTGDVALLKLHAASGLKAATIADSSSVRISQRVTAVGNAGGTGGRPSITRGQVTALGQSITVTNGAQGPQRLTGLIKSSASVQPGDSGGPLLDARGRVIGMVTAAARGFQSNGGGSAGFAIPINRAIAIARQIEAGRSSATVHVGPTAFLGVLTRPSDRPTFPGVVIAAVVPGSAAAKTGLVEGDVITSFDGQVVSTPLALTKLVQRVPPGRRTAIRWVDLAGKAHTASMRPAVGPPQ